MHEEGVGEGHLRDRSLPYMNSLRNAKSMASGCGVMV